MFLVWLRVHVQTCLKYLQAHFPTCFTCLRTHARMCLVWLSAHVPTCLAYPHTHVLTCFACSRVHVPTCLECLRASRVNMSLRAYVLTSQRGLKLTCSCANMPWVPCLTQLAWPCDHLPTRFASLVSSSDSIFFSFTVIAVEVLHTVGKV